MEGLQILGSALTIMGVLASLAFWLMKANYRLTQKNLQAKKELYDERLTGLKKVIDTLEVRLNQTQEKLDDTMKRLHLAVCAVQETKNTMTDFVQSTEKKIYSFETQVVQLTKKTNDLIIIKSKPKGVL